MYGGLDPFSLLAALAFGAFLLQLLLTLLNSSARSLNVVDLNTPLMMSDFHLPTFMTSADVSCRQTDLTFLTFTTPNNLTHLALDIYHISHFKEC